MVVYQYGILYMPNDINHLVKKNRRLSLLYMLSTVSIMYMNIYYVCAGAICVYICVYICAYCVYVYVYVWRFYACTPSYVYIYIVLLCALHVKLRLFSTYFLLILDNTGNRNRKQKKMMRRATNMMRDSSEFALLYTILNLLGLSSIGTSLSHLH